MTATRAVAPAKPGAALRQARAFRRRWRGLGRPGANLSDREFLAPALEILETPPSPVHVAFLWIICAFVLVALVRAYLGRIDIVAAAQGKPKPTGRVKVVEPMETGRVEDIRVANGSLVKAGDILVELDRSTAEAEAARARAELASTHGGKILRREAVARRGGSARGRFAAENRLASSTSCPGVCASASLAGPAADFAQLAANQPRSSPRRRKRPPSGTSSPRPSRPRRTSSRP